MNRTPRNLLSWTLSMLLLAGCLPPSQIGGSPAAPTNPLPASPSPAPSQPLPPSAPTTSQATLSIVIPNDALPKLRPSADQRPPQAMMAPTPADFDDWLVRVNGEAVTGEARAFAGIGWDDAGHVAVALELLRLPPAPRWRVEVANPAGTFRLVAIIEPDKLGDRLMLSAATTAGTLLADRLAALGHPDLAVPPEAIDILQARVVRALIDSSGDPLTISPVVGPLHILANAIIAKVPPAMLAHLPGIAAPPSGGGSHVATRRITTFAGGGDTPYNATPIAATTVRFDTPRGVTAGPDGAVYISSQMDHRVFRVDSTGTLTSIAGTGDAGYNGDGIAASSAQLSYPYGLAFNAAGDLHIAERTGRVRKVDALTGTITTVAGSGAGFGYDPAHEGIAATAATISPNDIAFDTVGNLYIADTPNSRIRKVDVVTGMITTVAGTGSTAYNAAEEGGSPTDASLDNPEGLALDAAGNLYIADTNHHRIRKVDFVAGTITTIAGTGAGAIDPGDEGGPATSANIGTPIGLRCDAAGHLYVVEYDSNRLRRIDAVTGTIATVAGTGGFGYAPAHEGVIPTQATLNGPRSVYVSPSGSVIYIADTNNNRIRVIR